jgi:hypothetical protein
MDEIHAWHEQDFVAYVHCSSFVHAVQAIDMAHDKGQIGFSYCIHESLWAFM